MPDPAVDGLEVVGRASEIETVRTFIDKASTSASCLLVQGRAGIGKTTLWKLGVGLAEERGFALMRCRGTPIESRLSFAALGDLLEGRLDDLSKGLAGPQREALDIALHRAPPGEDRPEPLAVHRAFYSAVDFVEASQPVMIAIDDAQWIDRSSAAAVAFAIRRASNRRIGVLIAKRDGAGSSTVDMLLPAVSELRPERLVVEALSLGALHHVLRARLGTTFHRPTLLRIQEMSQGNPFFALEIGRAVLEAGVEQLPGRIPAVPADLKQLLVTRLSSLSDPTREILLAFAAWPESNIEQVRTMLGVDIKPALDDAIGAGMIVIERGHVRFTHPLLASTIYEEAPTDKRKWMHGSIAANASNLEERARHLARTVDETDATAADLLEDAASGARARGAAHSAVDLYEQAIALTPVDDSIRRSTRILNMASCLIAAGDPEKARTLLESSVPEMERDDTWVDAIVALTEACYLAGDPEAALRHGEDALLEIPDAPRARGKLHSYLAWLAEDFPLDRSIDHATAAVELLDPELDAALLAIAYHNLFFCRVSAGEIPDENLLAMALDLESIDDTRYNIPPAVYWKCLDDYDRSRARFETHLEKDARTGDLSWVAVGYAHLAELDLWAGKWELAARELDAGESALQEMGAVWSWETNIYVRALYQVLAGEIEKGRAAVEGARERVASGYVDAMYRQVLGLAALLQGDPTTASVQLREVQRVLDGLGIREPMRFRFQQDLIEALVATGALDEAQLALDALEIRARTLPRPWFQVCIPRCRALVAAGRGDVTAALDHMDPAAWADVPLPLEVGRNWLILGRLRRRAKQKAGAREALETAIAIFESLPCPPFEAMARSDIERIGLRRSAGLELTETERRVAELAASGMTTREVAEALFMSVKTVEANLTRVYRKLGIGSRAELGSRMGASPQT